MRYLVFLLFSFSFSSYAFSQDTTITNFECEMPVIYDLPEVDPMFPGGQDSMMTFIGKNFVIPSIGVCGTWTVYIDFVINTDGSLTDIKILKGSGTVLDEEALRVVKLMPNWIPAQHGGKVVRSRYALPIRITV